MTTITAFAHHTPGSNVYELAREGGPVFRSLEEAQANVPAGKEVVEVGITSHGYSRFTVEGWVCLEPYDTLEAAVDATADAEMPLNAIQVFTAVHTENSTRHSVKPLSAYITSFTPVGVPAFDGAVLQPAIKEFLGHQKVLGGVEPREVTRRLLDLWLIADPDTEEKLAGAFPEMAWAIEKFQNNGLMELHKIIGYGE